mmetsp:Transcript_10257/g.20619  ORF Transcript_10257/g.20619 Transcript_10257/m.20619 type:complete len:170 (+) Transcript_10257:1497-2006(+)
MRRGMTQRPVRRARVPVAGDDAADVRRVMTRRRSYAGRGVVGPDGGGVAAGPVVVDAMSGLAGGEAATCRRRVVPRRRSDSDRYLKSRASSPTGGGGRKTRPPPGPILSVPSLLRQQRLVQAGAPAELDAGPSRKRFFSEPSGERVQEVRAADRHDGQDESGGKNCGTD